MTLRRTPRGRGGFTLVELLTVIGIISLLISILLPSLSRARLQAKTTKVKLQIDATGKGLEMFRNDYGNYPDSKLRRDPIDWTGAPAPIPADDYLSGAHWLARALVGHDFLGIDIKGLVLKDADAGTPPPGPGLFPAPNQLNIANLNPSTSPPGIYSERKGTYLEGEVFARDTDQKFGNAATGPYTDRAVIIDVFSSPMLYYRANSRSRVPFGDVYADGGIYNHEDNAEITGGQVTTGATIADHPSWDFVFTNSRHGVGAYAAATPVTTTNITSPPPTPAAGNPYKGKTFVNFLHSENTLETGNVIKPLNPETFLLMSAGNDGVFGTDDDVSNFKSGL